MYCCCSALSLIAVCWKKAESLVWWWRGMCWGAGPFCIHGLGRNTHDGHAPRERRRLELRGQGPGPLPPYHEKQGLRKGLRGFALSLMWSMWRKISRIWYKLREGSFAEAPHPHPNKVGAKVLLRQSWKGHSNAVPRLDEKNKEFPHKQSIRKKFLRKKRNIPVSDQGLCQFPKTVKTNYHQLGSFKWQKFILSQFKRWKVRNPSGSKVGSFWRLPGDSVPRHPPPASTIVGNPCLVAASPQSLPLLTSDLFLCVLSS